MNWWLHIIIGIGIVACVVWFFHHQRRLRLRAYLMQEAMRNRDFTFRLPTKGLLSGERAMQEALNQLGETIRQQVNQSEVESWERLTRVLTHEMMNATAPITSISQLLLNRPDVKGTPLEDGIRAIFDTSQHISQFVTNYRKMSELENPVLAKVNLNTLLDDVTKAYPGLDWAVSVPTDATVLADPGMLRQVVINLVKNAIEAGAKRMELTVTSDDVIASNVCLQVSNDGQPIPAENRQSLFVPFFTTKRTGSGIGLSLSRRMMVQQGGSLELADTPHTGFNVTFLLRFALQA